MKKLKLISGVLTICLLTGCVAQDNIDSSLDAIGGLASEAKSVAIDLKEKAEQGINYLGDQYNLNGDYDCATDRLKAYADDFKNQVADKLEEVSPEQADNIRNAKFDLDTVESEFNAVLEETQVENTMSYQFFNDFDFNHYDITYTVYNVDSDDTLVRNRVIKNGDNSVFCNSYEFTLADKNAFELLGLVYKVNESGTWYDCNQVTKEKSVCDSPLGYQNLEGVLNSYDPATFKASTLNNVISADLEGINVDRFVNETNDISFVFKNDELYGVIVTTTDETSIMLINNIAYGADNIELGLLTAAFDYKVIE